MEKQILRCAAYVRVSSEEQAKYGDSVRDQQERCLDYINRHENMVFQDIYIDDGVSGQKLERDEFERLMENVKADRIDAIIFTKIDRWFRNLRHYLNIQAILEQHGTVWTAIDQPYFDTSTPYGRAFINQSMMWAELEAQNGGVRITDVFRNKVKYGEVITGKVPRGYRIENKHLVLSEEAPAIYDTILYFLKHQSMAAAVRYLKNRHGISMSQANFKSSVLQNSKYKGSYRGNAEYCPRLISDELFDEIQAILNSGKNIKSGQRYPYLFSGLLVCRECGRKMSGCKINVLSRRPNGMDYRYHYPAYECKQHRAYLRCENGGEVRESRIEEHLLSNITAELEKYTVCFEVRKKEAVDNRNQKAAIKRKLDRLKSLYLEEMMTVEEYKSDREALLLELEQIPDILEPPDGLDGIAGLLNGSFSNLYATFDNPEKRRFWRAAVAGIQVSKSCGRSREFLIRF